MKKYNYIGKPDLTDIGDNEHNPGRTEHYYRSMGLVWLFESHSGKTVEIKQPMLTQWVLIFVALCRISEKDLKKIQETKHMILELERA